MKGLRWICPVIAIVALAVPIYAAATIASTTFKEQGCHAVPCFRGFDCHR